MLFDVTFDPFKVVLQHSINCTDDYLAIKFHTKRVLLEILDTYDPESLNLTWSGGMDSVFLGLCFNELVEEGILPASTFSFYTARYILDGKPCSIEFERGIDFYKKYINSDIALHVHDINLNDKTFLKKSCLLVNEVKQPVLGCLIQEQFRRDIGGQFIVNLLYPRRYDLINSLFNLNTEALWNYLPNSPCINVFDWDADSWSSLVTPFFINRPVIPYKKEYHHSKYLWDNMKGKTVQYMLCFPQLYELIFKHETVPYIGSFASNQEFLERMWLYGYENGNLTIQRYKLNVKNQDMNSYKTSIILPNGERITSVEQTQEFFNRHS